MNYELWLLKNLYLTWVTLWGLIHALHMYALMVVMICSSYVMMTYVMNMIMTYVFLLSQLEYEHE